MACLETKSCGYQRGFTLIEMMMVLVIVTVMLSIGIPSMRSVLLNNRMSSKLNEFVIAIQTARSEAVKNTRTAVLCKSTNGTSCAAATASWGDGLLVWIDTDGDSTVDANEIISVGAASTGFTFTGDGLADTTDLFDQSSIMFNAQGNSLVGGSIGGGTLKLCIEKQVAGQISLALSGRPTAEKFVQGSSEASSCP